MTKGTVRIGESVALHSDTGTDAATLDSVARTLREAGVHQLRYGDQPQEGELLLTIASESPRSSDEASTICVPAGATYPTSRLTPLRTLVRRATGNHITFVCALSPRPHRLLPNTCPLLHPSGWRCRASAPSRPGGARHQG